MVFKRLLIWVEGDDDKRFFDAVVKPRLGKKYDLIEVREYAQEKSKRINNFIRSINSMKANYILAADINDEPCVTEKKRRISKTYRNVDKEKTVIVIMEIESWYLAGLSDNACKKLGIRKHRSTNSITKEDFNRIMPKKFDSRIDYMLEIIKLFSITVAKRKNRSFGYFANKYKL